MSKRWSTEEVRALAPEPPVRKAAEAAARAGSWPVLGSREDGSGAVLLWGVHAGPPRRRASARIAPGAAPEHRCGCRRRAPSPCPHVLALLLLWSSGAVPESGAPPGWASRPGGPADPGAAARRAARREERAAEGLAELELWLRDRVDAGLASARGAGYAPWDAMAARLVDAQAGRVAERLRDLGGAVAAGGPEWPARLLAELALLRLLASARLRGGALPEGLRATARSRVGLPVSADRSAPVRDTWEVLGGRAFRTGRLDGLRFWLRGRGSGRIAALVSFAPEGGAPDAPVRPGTAVDAELAFYPAEHRASLVAAGAERPSGPPPGGTAAGALDSWAAALAEDPWLEAWPVVLEEARPARPREQGRWWLTDAEGGSLPLPADAAPPWRLAALSGGAPVTVAGEWTPWGLHPLTAWPPDGSAAPVPLRPCRPSGAGAGRAVDAEDPPPPAPHR
ncbi:hypothetical protein [Nocardiopsis potens]|uniref:hypothetical protein n=1 Tax=Nocardiopsis potens TaxID=1246458 RepID=UPI00034BA59B|nr:hypothetical protein [Nocardiopsis potens]